MSIPHALSSTTAFAIVLILTIWLWCQFADVWAVVVFGWAAGVMSMRLAASVRRWWQAVD